MRKVARLRRGRYQSARDSQCSAVTRRPVTQTGRTAAAPWLASVMTSACQYGARPDPSRRAASQSASRWPAAGTAGWAIA